MYLKELRKKIDEYGGPKISRADYLKKGKEYHSNQSQAECASEDDFKPHMMYDPKTGKGVKANTYADHVKYDKMGYTHEKPEVSEARARPPKIKKGLRDKKGKLHTVDMKVDGSKLSFRVTDEFGSFKTVNAKQLATMFESTENVNEAIDFFKTSKALSDYAKKSGGIDKRDFEKAAAYVREIGKNSSTMVQNKAFMGLKKHVSNMDTDPRDGVLSILKKHGMFKNGRLMQEQAFVSDEITEKKDGHIDQLRDIVKNKQAKKVNGVMVDMFTASAITQIYDKVNDQNKKRMDGMTVPALADIAYKMMKKR